MQQIESLESRRLLAGVTIITHGFEGDVTDWVAGMADAIAARAGGMSAVSEYILKVGLTSKNKLAILSFTRDAGSPVIDRARSGETVVKLDWSTVSDGAYSTVQVGDVVAAYLLQSHGGVPALAEQPIHLIGHSRGASLNTEIAKDLGQRGVWVDQFTSLDPHPVNGGSNNILGANFGDIAMQTWTNIVFADDYWRTNGNGNSLDPNGLPVNGAHIVNLNKSVQLNFVDSAHESVHAYYYGTSALTGVFDGEEPVESSWYGHTTAKPARDATGFVYSLIAGGSRPLDGIGKDFGGTAARVDPGESGPQYPNIGDIKVYNRRVEAGTSIKLRFTHQDRESNAEVVFYLDTDKNSYNGNGVRVMARRFFGRATAITAARVNAGTTGVAPGTYYIEAQTTDSDGQVRYDYAQTSVTIAAPPTPAVALVAFSTRLISPSPETTDLASLLA